MLNQASQQHTQQQQLQQQQAQQQGIPIVALSQPCPVTAQPVRLTTPPQPTVASQPQRIILPSSTK